MLLVDVRTPGEYAAGHLEDAVNINWLGAGFSERLAPYQEKKTIYLYCKKGGRSAKAARLLDSLGFSVVDLTGGYEAYVGKKNKK